MRIGYARVSTDEQSLDLPLDALKTVGCKQVFADKASAVKPDRPGLAEAESHLRSGDVIVVWKLDRLGRTVKRLVDFVAELQQQGVQFRSLTDGIDTTTPAGRFFFHVMASRPGWSGSCWPNAHIPAWTRHGAGLGGRRQTEDDAGQARIRPQAARGRHAAWGRGPKPRGLDPDALPRGFRGEPVTLRLR